MKTEFKTNVELNSFCMKDGWCPYIEVEEETRRYVGMANQTAEVLVYRRCKHIQICKHAYDLAQKGSEEKQRPKRVLRSAAKRCPGCGDNIDRYGVPFCESCGQALDWSE